MDLLLFFIYVKYLDKCLISCVLSARENSILKVILQSFGDDTRYTMADRTEKELLNILKTGTVCTKTRMRFNKLKMN